MLSFITALSVIWFIINNLFDQERAVCLVEAKDRDDDDDDDDDVLYESTIYSKSLCRLFQLGAEVEMPKHPKLSLEIPFSSRISRD